MKKTFKTVVSFLMMLAVLMSLATTVFAEAAIDEKATIEFKGFTSGFEFKPGSEYTETDLFLNFKNAMPGDVLTETITFTNSATDCDFVHLYMRAEAHDESNPISDKVAETETLASMTDFLSQLSMKVWNGTELIYDASPDQLGGLSQNKFLGTFRSGETAELKVELTVPKELGNKYANRVGEVDWVFHVEAFNEDQLSVRKIWSDGNSNHASESVTVNLLKNGQLETTAVLNAENGWAYTFDRLDDGHTWTVEEANVPDGYTVSYDTVGTTTTITNTKDAEPPKGDPLDITVKKVWSGDEASERPESVTVTLYNGDTEYQSVVLNENNGWTYTWKDENAYGNWQVVETNIPKDYTPSYEVKDGIVTITNTKRLIQTGQIKWPVAVLGSAGIALVAVGGVMILSKKKKNDNV